MCGVKWQRRRRVLKDHGPIVKLREHWPRRIGIDREYISIIIKKGQCVRRRKYGVGRPSKNQAGRIGRAVLGRYANAECVAAFSGRDKRNCIAR